MRALMFRMQAVVAGILVLTSGGASAWPAGRAMHERMEVPSSGLVELTRSRHRTHQVPVGVATIPGSSASRIPPVPQTLGGPKIPGTAPETSSDRIVRCTHHAGSFGLPQNEMGAYVHSCAFGN